MLVRRKPEIVRAVQWGTNEAKEKLANAVADCSSYSEHRCSCGHSLREHGRIVRNDDMVCPGEWIIIDGNGDLTTCSAEEFTKHYETLEQ